MAGICAIAWATEASAWQATIKGNAGGEDRANAVSVDAAGDVIAAGVVRNRASRADFVVVKRARADGRDLWRAVVNGTANGDDRANALAVDQAGDVVAAGVIQSATAGFAVAKFAGATGVERWRAMLKGSADGFGEALAVAVDRTGDVVAVGRVTNNVSGIDFVVVKLSGATGAQIWRRDIDGALSNDVALAVTVDGSGDVVASGFFINPETGADFVVLKLDGANGGEVWRRILNGAASQADLAVALTVDGSGDVIAAGTLANGTPESPRPDFVVVKLARATGAELWRAVFAGGGARAVAVDEMSDVVAAGVLANASGSSDFAVVKLAGATGAPLWRRVVNEGAGSQGGANAVAVDAAGRVVAAGFLIDRTTYFTVVTLEGASGADVVRAQISGGAGGFDEAFAVAVHGDGEAAAAGLVRHGQSGDDFFLTSLRTQLAGRQLVLQDSPRDSSKRKLIVLSQDPVIVAGTPGGVADPTLTGGALTIFNPGTDELAVIALPASKWTGLGNPAGSGGYEYADNRQSAGPCKAVTLKPGEALQASCTGQGIGFTLNEAAQGSLGITLTTGTLEHCLLFGGRIVKDVPAVGNRIGEFQATTSPVPSSCLVTP